MSELHEVLRLIQLWEFVAVAGVAAVSWARNRGKARAWVAATFLLLAGVVVAARLIPEGSTDPIDQLFLKILLGGLVLFPYFLFRFTATFRAFSKWAEMVAAGTTAVVSAWAFTFENLPRAGEVRPPEFETYVTDPSVPMDPCFSLGRDQIVAVRQGPASSGSATDADPRRWNVDVGTGDTYLWK